LPAIFSIGEDSTDLLISPKFALNVSSSSILRASRYTTACPLDFAVTVTPILIIEDRSANALFAVNVENKTLAILFVYVTEAAPANVAE